MRQNYRPSALSEQQFVIVNILSVRKRTHCRSKACSTGQTGEPTERTTNHSKILAWPSGFSRFSQTLSFGSLLCCRLLNLIDCRVRTPERRNRCNSQFPPPTNAIPHPPVLDVPFPFTQGAPIFKRDNAPRSMAWAFLRASCHAGRFRLRASGGRATRATCATRGFGL